MDEKTQKLIADQMKILPKDVMQAIVSVDYKSKLREITSRQKLFIDQGGKLEMETTLVMIGLEPLSDYITNLQKELGVTYTKAKEVAMDVSENIFKPIRDSLRVMDESLKNPTPKTEEPVTKFTNSNETTLNRDQILKEIEDPSLIDGGNRNIQIEIAPKPALPSVITNTVETKLTAPTVGPQQIINVKPETKVPEIENRRP
jgi:hypothetical protein